MRFVSYPKYRDSEVDWIGDVPAHWRVVRVKDIAEIVNGFPFDAAKFSSEDGHPLVRIRDLNCETSEALYSGSFVEAASITSADVLIGMDGDFNVGRWKGSGRALLNQRMCCVRARDANATAALEYALPFPLKAINEITYSTTVKHLSSYQVAKVRVAIPPPKELASMVRFLDRETNKIDTLIAKQERLIELLQEKRQAVISHAVTKGLNPMAPMKDSGVDWLGNVPAHWETPPLRAIANVVRGASPRPAGDLRYFGGDAIPWVTVAEITKDDAMYVSETAEGLTAEGREYSRVFPAGTLLFSNSGATLGVPKICSMAACANDGVVGFLSLDQRVNIEFLYFLLLTTTQKLRDEIKQGAGQPNLNTSIVKAIRMGMPSLAEQKQIVEYIKVVLDKMDELTAKARRSIVLMREHRSALISAAVTGKIDVRGT